MLRRFLALAVVAPGFVSPAQAGPVRDYLASRPHHLRDWVRSHRPGILVPKLAVVVPQVMPVAKPASPACPGGVCPVPTVPSPKVSVPPKLSMN